MISVIIPVYNVEDYLHVCINSVLKQTYQDFEIICIDDDSTDSSLEILEYFTQKDSRIKILKNDTNKGPGYSRNRGLEVAQGKYISFLDGDDWFSFNAFEILIKKIEQDNLDVLIFKNIVYYNEPQEFGFEKYYDMKYMDKFTNQVFNHWDLDKTNLFKISNAPWNKIYLKSFLDDNNIRFPNENLIHEDNPFFYKVITSAKKVSIVDKYLHNRRRRSDSIMTLNDNRLFDVIDISYKIFDIFFEDKELYDYYKKEVLKAIFVSRFKMKYNQIDDELKEKFFRRVQEAFKVYIEKYGLYEDIKENVSETIREFFKFDDIVNEILSSNAKK
ncbi:glycosyltransferase family 2 protein [Methanobrevibacter sp.]|uniref:glycosyltransferase family 2 protein n=1 Tax=Methanobrevibacter sp. TaxID=66852 RepID=UPI0025DEE615|nr:glycosyltransferase family 2 protein [Methanobrevibacter sp.]MBQ6511111.1 glycosyltransferase family 2 protein [Methanobrevibacter sp.]